MNSVRLGRTCRMLFRRHRMRRTNRIGLLQTEMLPFNHWRHSLEQSRLINLR